MRQTIRWGPLLLTHFILLFCFVGGLTAQEKPYRFEVRVETVYVDVFASQNGKPVRGLSAEDFEVSDNGVRQQIELVDVESVPTSAMLVLDTSGSVTGSKLRHLREAAHAFVDGLDEDDEAGLLTVTEELHLKMRLGSDFKGLHAALDEPMKSGATVLVDALFAGLKLLERARGRPLLLLFTDGMDNMSWLDASDALDVAGSSEAIVYVVGVGSRAGVRQLGRLHSSGSAEATRFLDQIAKVTGGQVWYADTTVLLEDVFLGVVTSGEESDVPILAAEEDKRAVGLLPSTHDVFSRSEELWVFTEIYWSSSLHHESLELSTTLKAPDQTVVFESKASDVGLDMSPKRALSHQVRIPMALVPPGEYLLEIKAETQSGGEETRSRALVRIR